MRTFHVHSPPYPSSRQVEAACHDWNLSSGPMRLQISRLGAAAAGGGVQFPATNDFLHSFVAGQHPNKGFDSPQITTPYIDDEGSQGREISRSQGDFTQSLLDSSSSPRACVRRHSRDFDREQPLSSPEGSPCNSTTNNSISTGLEATISADYADDDAQRGMNSYYHYYNSTDHHHFTSKEQPHPHTITGHLEDSQLAETSYASILASSGVGVFLDPDLLNHNNATRILEEYLPDIIADSKDSRASQDNRDGDHIISRLGNEMRANVSTSLTSPARPTTRGSQNTTFTVYEYKNGHPYPFRINDGRRDIPSNMYLEEEPNFTHHILDSASENETAYLRRSSLILHQKRKDEEKWEGLHHNHSRNQRKWKESLRQKDNRRNLSESRLKVILAGKTDEHRVKLRTPGCAEAIQRMRKAHRNRVHVKTHYEKEAAKLQQSWQKRRQKNIKENNEMRKLSYDCQKDSRVGTSSSAAMGSALSHKEEMRTNIKDGRQIIKNYAGRRHEKGSVYLDIQIPVTGQEVRIALLENVQPEELAQKLGTEYNLSNDIILRLQHEIRAQIALLGQLPISEKSDECDN
mmetsp:Transcript_3347/g.5184  ORF Transcript_3347/g.5184 Transcript_3347/m.5184 type:complete len:576 (-) Transcript_3347:110-1837(-)